MKKEDLNPGVVIKHKPSGAMYLLICPWSPYTDCYLIFNNEPRKNVIMYISGDVWDLLDFELVDVNKETERVIYAP